MIDTKKQIDAVVASIEKIKAKDGNIYFFVQDTKNNPKASVGFIYELVKLLREENYKAFILHDDEYKQMDWLGKEYTNLPHLNINTNFSVGTHDVIVLPELLSYIMEQVTNIPCIKVVLVQAHDWLFETLPPGNTWSDFGFDRCITVSGSLKEFVSEYFNDVKIDVVEPFINDVFTKSELPQKPFIAIHTREQTNALKIIKAFYVKYPQYRWFGFRDLRGLSREEFARQLKECCLSVWVDSGASFGTFPLESMKSGIPVIGKIPTKIPEWMTDENGVWVSDEMNIVDHIAKYIAYWLEDSVPESFYQELEGTVSQYSKEKTKKQLVSTIETYYGKRVEALEEALNKLEEKLKNEESISHITSA